MEEEEEVCFKKSVNTISPPNTVMHVDSGQIVEEMCAVFTKIYMKARKKRKERKGKTGKEGPLLVPGLGRAINCSDIRRISPTPNLLGLQGINRNPRLPISVTFIRERKQIKIVNFCNNNNY